LTGITFYKGNIFVAVTMVKRDGSKEEDIINGLPSFGDHHNNRVIFGPDGKMYFGQGTVTNSGVVGEDNARWIKEHPFCHDYPGSFISLTGKNFKTKKLLSRAINEQVKTGGILSIWCSYL
jgi:hypothetical protein